MNERLIVLNPNIVSANGAIQWHVKDSQSGKFYMVSGVHAMLSGWEVLVFAADSHEKITDYTQIAGGRGITHEEALRDLYATIVENEEM